MALRHGRFWSRNDYSTGNNQMKAKRAKRYFGMTVAQLTILGCLALTVCGMLSGGFFLVSGSMGRGFSIFSSPEPTSTLQPTSTPYLTETPSFTPTSTLIPYEDLVPSGWDQYITTSVELWLPSQFEPADIDKKRQESIDFYKDIGYADMAEEMEERPSAIVFWFETSEPSKTLYRTNITVEPVLMTAANLDDYLDQETTSGLQEFVVVNRKEIQVGNYEARRFLFEANLSNVYIGVAQYAVFDGINVWYITCASHFNEFYTWLPEFDKITRTFRLIDQ